MDSFSFKSLANVWLIYLLYSGIILRRMTWSKADTSLSFEHLNTVVVKSNKKSLYKADISIEWIENFCTDGFYFREILLYFRSRDWHHQKSIVYILNLNGE